MRLGACVLAGVLLLVGCGRRPAGPGAHPAYVVGAPYQAGIVWFYPHEDFRLDTTGVASVLPSHAGLTADGEPYNPAAMAAAHPTLQLPAIARVTNLETGLQVAVRINDRGTPDPKRLIGLTPRAAGLLGIPPGGVARVRLQVDAGASQALRDALRGGDGAIAASVPRGIVTSESLPPPPGVEQAEQRRATALASAAGTPLDGPVVPAALPETATRVPVGPGQLWVSAGDFGRPEPARMVQARLSVLRAMIERVGQGRAESFRLRAGPFATVADADMALDQAVRAGVTDARIVIE